MMILALMSHLPFYGVLGSPIDRPAVHGEAMPRMGIPRATRRGQRGPTTELRGPTSELPVEIAWLADTPWHQLDNRRKHIVDALRPFSQFAFIEPPPALAWPLRPLSTRGDVSIGKLAPLLNTRRRWAQKILQPTLARLLAEHLVC